MELEITNVDYAPPELHEQTPFMVELLRELPGDDRPDYWLGHLRKPLRWINEDIEQEITHVVVAARWQGTKIQPLVKNLPVGIAYVTDLRQLEESRFDLKRCAYVAIGIAHEVMGGATPKERTGIISGFIGRAFGLGNKS